MSNKNLIIVGVSGASGSGKSLLSHSIVDDLGSERVVVITEDCYYKNQQELTLCERENTNYDHPKQFEHSLLEKHIKELLDGQDATIPTYDFTTHTRSNKTLTINHETSIIILEGILIFHDKRLRKLMDIKIYVDTPLDISLLRRMQRDVSERGRTIDSVIKQYRKTVRPMYIKYIQPTRRYADIIIPRGGKNRVAIDIIRAKMRELV
ncbi:MAG: uridine kinase [Francisellaceae bacterium]|jgi:uridine kinase